MLWWVRCLSLEVQTKGSVDNSLPRNKMSIRALLSKTERMQTQRTVRYEVTFVKRENVIVKTKLSLS